MGQDVKRLKVVEKEVNNIKSIEERLLIEVENLRKKSTGRRKKAERGGKCRRTINAEFSCT